MQPIVSDDVAAALADVAIAEPLNDRVEVAGPGPIRMDELVRRFLSAKGDPRKVITDVRALYYGTGLTITASSLEITPASAQRASRTGSASPFLKGNWGQLSPKCCGPEDFPSRVR
jgi:uncharacterized protein YbjT (DUF2867 family)